MIHIVIVRDPIIFQLILSQTEPKKVPLKDLPYEVYSQGNIRIVGRYEVPVEEVLISVMKEFNPDTVFFLSESYPVSDEKLSGDIILPNVFFQYNPEIEATDDIETLLWESETVQKRSGSSTNREPEWIVQSQYDEWGSGDLSSKNELFHSSQPIFLEHYPLQGDYNFESFGLSVGGIHVSGEWNTEIEDFRIRLRVVYENDTFDSDLYHFIEAAKKQEIIGKMYPVAYIWTEDKALGARNLWSIVGFIIGSIDPDLISEEETEGWEDEEEWVDGKEE